MSMTWVIRVGGGWVAQRFGKFVTVETVQEATKFDYETAQFIARGIPNAYTHEFKGI